MNRIKLNNQIILLIIDKQSKYYDYYRIEIDIIEILRDIDHFTVQTKVCSFYLEKTENSQRSEKGINFTKIF